MNLPKKKSYSKKPSKKERLATELAQKATEREQAERLTKLTDGGGFVRADGVGISAVAVAARQKALHAALAEQDVSPADSPSNTRRPSKNSVRDTENLPEKIAAPDEQGKRLAHALWCAQCLLIEVLRFDMAADKQVSQYLRAHHELGARDRHVVAETIYAVLRHRRVLAHLAQSGSGALERRLVLLGAVYHTNGTAAATLAQMQTAVEATEYDWLASVITAPIHDLPPDVRSNLPDPWWQALVAVYGESDGLALATALNDNAPLDLRVNTVKSSPEAVLVALDHAGIPAQPCPFAPLGIRVAGKPLLQKLDIFTSGAIEVQDEGSQLLTHLLGAKRGEMVADFCAGAGGKTLAIGALMRNTGRLYAFDVAAHRLAKLKPRLARSGLSNVHIIAIESEGDIRVKRLRDKFDRVLVDAPCSGMGTLRRNPDLKWRHGIDSVARLSELQAAILARAARLVKIGGTLVYATCSVLPAENQDIVSAFLAAHPDFKCLSAAEVLAERKIALPDSAYCGDFLQLLPHLHQTDGFFAACLQRVK